MQALQHPMFQAFSGLVVLFLLLSWVRPTIFRFLLDKGNTEPSLSRIGQYNALLISSWGVVALVLKETPIPEWFFSTFMLAFAGAQFGSLWLKFKSGITQSNKDK